MIIFNPVLLTVNAQSLGITGKHYRVTWALSSSEDKIMELGQITCNLQAAREASDGCHFSSKTKSRIQRIYKMKSSDEKCKSSFCDTPTDLYNSFWHIWKTYRQAYRCALFCTSYRPCPFVSNLFENCILLDRDARKTEGPNPIINLRSLLKATGVRQKSMDFDKVVETVISWTQQFWEAHSRIESRSIPQRLSIKYPETIFSFDVERWGLYGNPFWIGYVISVNNKEIECGQLTSPPDEALADNISSDDKNWVEEHVLPHFPGKITDSTYRDMLISFGCIWKHWKEKSDRMIFLGKRIYPIEMATLRDSFHLTREKGEKIRMLADVLDIQSRILLLKIKENDYPRIDPELPEHNPENDARYCLRLKTLTDELFLKFTQTSLEEGPKSHRHQIAPSRNEEGNGILFDDFHKGDHRQLDARFLRDALEFDESAL